MNKSLRAIIITFGVWLLMGTGVVHRTPGAPLPQATYHIPVGSPDGEFTIADLTGPRTGDTIQWDSLEPEDSIVRISDPGTSDPCDGSFKLPVDSFSGPIRTYVPGIWLRGSANAGQGPEVIPDTDSCECEPGCTPEQANGLKYCSGQAGIYNRLPPETWAIKHVYNGALLLYDWSDIETSDGHFDGPSGVALLQDIREAANHGWSVKVGFTAGVDGTPPWLGSAGVTMMSLRDTNDGGVPGGGGCGTPGTVGDITDPDYGTQVDQLINWFFDQLETDPALFNTVVAMHVPGINYITDELKIANSCHDENRDGYLDTGTGCTFTCNTFVEASNGWKRQEIVDYLVARGETINARNPNADIAFGLIQGGFPKIADPAPNASICSGNCLNFEGDSLKDPGPDRIPGNADDFCLYDPDHDGNCAENTADDGAFADFGSVDTLEAWIDACQAAFGDRCRVAHYGLGEYPTEVDAPQTTAQQDCSYANPLEVVGGLLRAVFPMVKQGNVSSQQQCPNRWAVMAGLLPDFHPTGFQVNNSGNGIDNAFAHESSLWNMTVNSNSDYIEWYGAQGWLLYQLLGPDNPMDPARVLDTDDAGNNGQGTPYDNSLNGPGSSKSLAQWDAELELRRGIFPGSAYPTTYTWVAGAPGDYYYYNPRTCADGPGKVGHINVVAP